MTTQQQVGTFYGWRVVGGAFVLAVFGWGTGFYGPPVFLSVLHETRGWPIGLISAAVTLHFLTGAVVGANLPAIHRRLGVVAATKISALVMAMGLIGWPTASEPWQLFVASLLSGAGWSGMSAAALNAIVSPWFDRRRPAALAMAYNGGSIGGVVFSPLWVAAIGSLGFSLAAVVIAVVMVLTLWLLADVVFSRTPEQLGQAPDGDTPGAPSIPVTSPLAQPLPGLMLWRDWQFRTLAAGMALGLFAQIGLVAHLFSLLAPALGPQLASFAMALVTAMAIAGRTVLGWMMRPEADRRLIAAAGYAVQLLGSLAFLAAEGGSVPWLLLGAILFGAGFGNATSLPPLVAQVEFVRADVARAVPLAVGIAQGVFAFAPAAFGLIREFAPSLGSIPAASAPYLFIAAALIQALAIAAFVMGRQR